MEPDDPVLWTGDDYTLGVTDLETQSVYIADDLDDEKLYDVLSHEICHCLMFSYNYDFSIPEEECVCQIMEEFSDDVLYLTDRIYSQL